MQCPICHGSSWEKVDQFRIKAVGMSMCTSCGFVTYPERHKTKAQVLEYYRKEYRGTPPKVGNLFTGQTKLHYHDFFLKDLIAKWASEGKKDPVVCDTGAAFGLFLAWWKNLRNREGLPTFPNVQLYGTELTTSFRRVAYHEFGLHLSEEFDASRKYDLISSYKVAEHIFDIDQELKRYRDALKPEGYLYISVPIWFFRMHNFGASGWDIEYYYHPDHCNVWTLPHFKRLLEDSGFCIEKEDYDIYDATFLCTPKDPLCPTPLPTPEEVLPCLERVFKANNACIDKQFEEALSYWPNFPVARRAAYEYQRNALHQKGYDFIKETHVKPWLDMDPNYMEALLFAADIALRYLKFDDAEKYALKGIENRPFSEPFYVLLANIFRTRAHKDDQSKRFEYIDRARQCMQAVRQNSLNGFQNAVTWIYNDAASLPLPEEMNLKQG